MSSEQLYVYSRTIAYGFSSYSALCLLVFPAALLFEVLYDEDDYDFLFLFHGTFFFDNTSYRITNPVSHEALATPPFRQAQWREKLEFVISEHWSSITRYRVFWLFTVPSLGIGFPEPFPQLCLHRNAAHALEASPFPYFSLSIVRT